MRVFRSVDFGFIDGYFINLRMVTLCGHLKSIANYIMQLYI